MKSLSTPLSGRTRRMCLVLGGLGLAGLLAACASQPGVGDTPTEFQTASDESPARARARTRLALASGYFENGQHVVALDEQKKAVQADPTFADAYNQLVVAVRNYKAQEVKGGLGTGGRLGVSGGSTPASRELPQRRCRADSSNGMPRRDD